MPDSVALRRAWGPRVLSILRIMVGVLYMEHGLAKILDFPHQPTHPPFTKAGACPAVRGATCFRLSSPWGAAPTAAGASSTAARTLPENHAAHGGRG